MERPPVWIMRQAGRYLPEYRAVRERADFLAVVGTPELAAELTLQPVDILSVDAAIIFSDILVIPQAMGMRLTVEEGTGPRFHKPLRCSSDVAALRDVLPEDDLGYVLEAIRLARRSLDGRVPLIGFAGGPWTLAAYMIEGGSSANHANAKRFLVEEPSLAHDLLSRLAKAAGEFLRAQVKAGAQVVQVFESLAGALAPQDFRNFALPYLAEVVAAARESGAPVIAFARGAGWALGEVAEATSADVIGVDWKTQPAEARRNTAAFNVSLQGNLDPCWLYASPSIIRERTTRMLEAFGGRGHIANLGHGILPDTPVEHARAFVDTVREWRVVRSHASSDS